MLKNQEICDDINKNRPKIFFGLKCYLLNEPLATAAAGRIAIVVTATAVIATEKNYEKYNENPKAVVF